MTKFSGMLDHLDGAVKAVRSHLKSINEFEIYANSTETLHNDYVYKFALPFEKINDPVEFTLLLQKYWYHSLTISVIYLLLIKLLQRFMRHREPFQLKTPLFYWNTGLAIFSLFGFVRSLEDVVYTLSTLGIVHSMCYTVNPTGVAAFWALMFALSKIVELGDTFFIVLRKRKVIFLHCYHHIIVIIGAAHGGAAHAAHGRFFVTVNYFVHAIMYAYFAHAATGRRPSRLVAMLITTLQIVQMLGGVAVTYIVHQIKLHQTAPCQQTLGHVYLGYWVYGSFTVLFVQFFIDAYIRRPKLKKKAE